MAGPPHCMSSDLTDRVRALERAVSTRDEPPTPIPAISGVSSEVSDLDDRVVTIESRVADLAARQQAVEAYVDQIDHVNDTIERRADAALAAVDRLESTCQGRTTTKNSPNRDPADASDPSRRATGASSAETSAHVMDAASTDAGATQETDSPSGSLIARVLGL